MLTRLKRDVLDKKPDWVTVSCGMNDVIHGAKGVPLDQYKINMTAIVEQCQAAGIKVMILTTTTAGAWNSDGSKRLSEYSACLRDLAKEKHCIVYGVTLGGGMVTLLRDHVAVTGQALFEAHGHATA